MKQADLIVVLVDNYRATTVIRTLQWPQIQEQMILLELKQIETYQITHGNLKLSVLVSADTVHS